MPNPLQSIPCANTTTLLSVRQSKVYSQLTYCEIFNFHPLPSRGFNTRTPQLALKNQFHMEETCWAPKKGLPSLAHFRTFLKELLLGLKSYRATQPGCLTRLFPSPEDATGCDGPAATVSSPRVCKGALPRVLALGRLCPRQEAPAPGYHGDAGTACAHLWLMGKEEGKFGCFRTN